MGIIKNGRAGLRARIQELVFFFCWILRLFLRRLGREDGDDSAEEEAPHNTEEGAEEQEEGKEDGCGRGELLDP